MMTSFFMEAVTLAFVFGSICGTLVALQISGRRYQTAVQHQTRQPH